MKFSDIINKNGVIWDKVITIPEFAALQKTPQNSRWHQEGNALIHTKLVVKEMLRTLTKVDDRGGKYWLIMMAAALCHDLGKAVTTRWDDEKNDYSSPHHGYEGEKIVRRLFFDEDIMTREKVCYMVRWHMTMHHILEKPFEEQGKEIFRLTQGMMELDDLIILGQCDAEGSINEESLDNYYIQNKFDKVLELSLKFRRNFLLASEIDNKFDRLAFSYHVDRHKDDIHPFNVTLIIGVAGAGKDTWVSEHLPDDVMLCRDNIRTEIGIKGEKPFGTKEQEKKVTMIFNERLIDCCKNHKDVVINNTNLLKKYRTEFVKTVLPYNPFITFVYVEPNEMEDCAKRRTGQIKKEIVNGMWDRLDFPELSECDRLLISKQDADGDSFTSEFTDDNIVWVFVNDDEN